jgi:undecaprenyl-diphosphatase
LTLKVPVVSRIEIIVAILAGIVQGIVEWLPVSSQGNLALFLTVAGSSPEQALQLALFLQLGTTVAAATYYREDILEATAAVPDWRPSRAFFGPHATTSFVVVATIATGLVGIPIYVYAVDVASDLTGGIFLAVIGVLLILTGVLQIASRSVALGTREHPGFVDACLVGAAQGLTILPGVSRSGTTTSVLLFREYSAPAAFRFSFLLSIPASLGAAALTVASAGGLPGISPVAAVTALAVSALVGYLAIGTLMQIVERIPFWAICFGLGGLAIVGGGLVTWLV